MSTTAQGQAVGNYGVGDLSAHKRPWEEVPGEPERPGHISRAQMHFDKHIIDRNEPRANHPGWVERPPKKRRSTKSHHQAARDHQSVSHARSHHEYHSSRPISYGPPPVPPMYDPLKPGPSIHTPEGRTYTPVGWRQQGEEFGKNAKNQEPLTMDVDETLPPPLGWTERPRVNNLLPIGRGVSSQGDSHSGSSQSPQAPQRPSYHPSQHLQPYLLPIDERPPPPQSQQQHQHYQQPPPRQESPGPPPSNYQLSQQQSNYQPPPQRPIDSSEPPRQQQDWSEYRREDSRERPSPSMPVNHGWAGYPPPSASQSSYDQRSVNSAQEPARYQSQQPERHEYHQQPPPQQQQQPGQPEYRHAPRTTSPTRFREQVSEPQQQQQPPAPQYHTHTRTQPLQSQPQPSQPQSHPRTTISGAECGLCDTSGRVLRVFDEQLDEINKVFGHFGDYQEIHEEYTSRGYSHDDVPGFKEFHRIVELVKEASVLTKYMVGVAPVVKRMLKGEKVGDPRLREYNGEMVKLMQEMNDRVRELGPGTDESRASSSYTSEPRSQVVGFIAEQRQASMAPPPIPQQQPSPITSQNERQQTTQLAHHPQSPAPSASSQIEPPSTRRTSTLNASLPSQNPANSANIPTFSVESSDPTLEAKLTKLKARLETEIGEVDNLTEEKKRLEERIKELEAMVEEERKRRRGEIDVGMKDRTSFLSVLEGVVALGRREGDPVIKRESGLSSSNNSSSTSGDGAGGGGGGQGESRAASGEGSIEELRKEVEKLRERNRVCESALEHIKRETRHMKETCRKVEESRRGVDLVLGRVLAGRENPVQVGGGGEVLAIVAPPAPVVEAVEAVPAVIEAPPAVPVVARALTPAVESQASKEDVEVKE